MMIPENEYVPGKKRSAEQKQVYKAQKQQKKLLDELNERKRRTRLTPVEIRDREARKQRPFLWEDHRENLRERGWKDEWISDAISKNYLCSGYLFGDESQRGFRIFAMDFQERICGAQGAMDNREPKYKWESRNQSVHLPETGDNPLFNWKQNGFDWEKFDTLMIVEGSLKSLGLSYQYANRTGDSHRITTGFGSTPSNETILNHLLELKQRGLNQIVICPDGDWQNAKPNVRQHWLRWIKGAWKLGINIKVAWWNQWTKKSPDADELENYENVRLIPASTFLAMQPWKRQQSYTADLVTTGRYVEFADLVEEGIDLCVKAPLGAGKSEESTRLLKRFADVDRQTFFAVPNQTLRRDLMGRFTKAGMGDRVFQVDKDIDLSVALQCSNAIILFCIDSGYKVPLDSFETALFCIEEAETNQKHYLQRNTAIKHNRAEVLEHLNKALKKSWANLILGANLSDETCNFYKTDKRQLKLSHQPIRPKRLMIRFLDTSTKTEILDLIDKALIEHSSTIVVLCDSLKQLKALQVRYEGQFKTRMICSEDEGEEWRKESSSANPELTNEQDINNFILNDRPQLFLCSPSVLAGFNIDVQNYFDHVFLMGMGVVGCEELEQFLSRVRDEKVSRTVWVEREGLKKQFGGFSADSIEEMASKMAERLRQSVPAKYGIFDDDDEDEEERKPTEFEIFQEVMKKLEPQAEILFKSENERTHLRQFYLQRLIDAGHEIEILNELDGSDQAQKDQKATVFELSLRRANRVQKARDISEKEYQEISNKARKSSDEKTEFDRYKVVHQLHGIEHTTEWNDETLDEKENVPKNQLFIRNLLEGKWIEQARVQVLYNLPVESNTLHEDQWEKMLKRGYAEEIKTVFGFNKVMRECGLDKLLAMEMMSDRSKEVQAFIKNCRQRKYLDAIGLGGTLFNDKKAVSAILEKLGYKKERVKTVDGVRFYRIVSAIPRSVILGMERWVHSESSVIWNAKHSWVDVMNQARKNKIVYTPQSPQPAPGVSSRECITDVIDIKENERNALSNDGLTIKCEPRFSGTPGFPLTHARDDLAKPSPIKFDPCAFGDLNL
ncbi:hypothetical protein ACQ4M3_09325 [Leptolyngbya sp. AN03gr2]|uniref:hypothetical protein n=1 Tax=Leptolyngbya sp. AN03gr2 TaxID=3423364 RepID=UPI003D31A8D1